MKVVTFTIDDVLMYEFREALMSTACTQPQILRAAVASYAKGDLKFDCGELVSTQEPVHTMIQLEPEVKEKGKPGRPKTHKEEEPVKLESDPFTAYKNKVPISQRTLGSYNHVVGPHLTVDERPHLEFDSPDGNGRVFHDYFNEYWLEFRRECHTPGQTTASDWFDISLEMYMTCITNKFIEDNNLSLRYHPDELVTEVIEANTALEIQYKEELEELYKEPT